MFVEEKVRTHFDADAKRFDQIYDDTNKGSFASWVDRVWRGVVRRRLELTLQLLAPLDGKSILDVGCGSGRFCVAYAERGARVLGIDFSQNMIDLACQLATSRGVADRCVYRKGMFPQDVTETGFDACTALGFFDYVADPVPLIRRMREIAPVSIMSFPKAWEWRVPIRRMRFWLSGCPLYLYTRSQVLKLLTQAGVARHDWTVLDRDYLVTIRA